MGGVKTDCFAYEKRESANGKTKELCKAMNALYCETGECKFYKNTKQACAECVYKDCKGCPNPLASE